MKTTKKKWLSLSVASGLIVTGLLVPYSSAYAAEAVVPISANVVKTDLVSSIELKSNSKWLVSNIKVPVLQGLQDKKFEAQLNDTIKSIAEKDLAYWEAEADKDAVSMKENGFEMRPYELWIVNELKSGGSPDGFVSLKVITQAHTGGTGMPRVDTYTFMNTAEATNVTLQSLFGDSYKETINAAVKAEIAKTPDRYMPDAFEGITDEQTFYVENGDAVIVFPKYSIAPGVAGTPEFRIPIPAKSTDDSNTPTAPSVSFQLDKSQYYTDPNGVTMVPLRHVAEKIGFTIQWNGDTMTAELNKGANWTSVTIGKDAYFFARMAPQPLGAAPVIVDSLTYVPLKFVTDILKAEVNQEADGITIVHS